MYLLGFNFEYLIFISKTVRKDLMFIMRKYKQDSFIIL